ncbi:MAG: Fe-S cluster assembly protein NifU [Planctomycetota bacterium]|nr:Fe-S cluster assembly protein NifU [Planctomycetota bacterium]
MWDYNKKVKELFLNPKNTGEIEDADGTGEVGSISCGDAMKLTIKVENGVIVDAKFKTFGCGSAIASASALTEMIKGKTVEEAEKITNADIVEFLGGLPRQKMHCSVMGAEALEAAINDYKGIETVENGEDEGEVVCHCFGITDKEIEKVARQNRLKEVEDVTNYTKAGGGCGGCLPQIQNILNRIWSEEPPEPRTEPKTFLEKVRLIERCIEDEIRPILNQDGGDIELVDIQGDKVLVKLLRNCADRLLSEFTPDDFVGEERGGSSPASRSRRWRR